AWSRWSTRSRAAPTPAAPASSTRSSSTAASSASAWRTPATTRSSSSLSGGVTARLGLARRRRRASRLPPIPIPGSSTASIPSEETFTTPDPTRTEGRVTATKPLDISGTVIEGLRVRFENGRAVEIDADRGGDVLRGRAGKDEGAARLGEVALVDRAGRIAESGSVFFNTLLDENAASHIALGNGYRDAVDESQWGDINDSQIHIDFMIGSPEVDVFGMDTDGNETPVLVAGDWQI